MSVVRMIVEPAGRFARRRHLYYRRVMARRWLTAAAFIMFLAVPVGAAEKLNLNTATQQQLEALGLSDSQAMQVIAHRQKSGPFLQVEELMAVQQMKKETFEKIRDQVTVDE